MDNNKLEFVSKVNIKPLIKNHLEGVLIDICNFLIKGISNLKNLVFLDLSKNRLRCLPEEIGACSKLSDLHLSENNLTVLPETIGI